MSFKAVSKKRLGMIRARSSTLSSSAQNVLSKLSSIKKFKKVSEVKMVELNRLKQKGAEVADNFEEEKNVPTIEIYPQVTNREGQDSGRFSPDSSQIFVYREIL